MAPNFVAGLNQIFYKNFMFYFFIFFLFFIRTSTFWFITSPSQVHAQVIVIFVLFLCFIYVNLVSV